MITLRRFRFLLLFIIATFILSAPLHAERATFDLTGSEWHVFRDFDAAWERDPLFPPPADIAGLPVNPPSCGWDALSSKFEASTVLPATIEGLFWGDNGSFEGVAGDYRGVSWWVTWIDIPAGFAGKRVLIAFESVHLRAEVFVNRTLTGYDIVGGTPFTVDATGAVKEGRNEIAVRITDPIGNFTWNDRPVMKWGDNDIPAAHGFGGITGRVGLRAVDPVAIDDIWVRNTTSITSADAVVSLNNSTGTPVKGRLNIVLHPDGDSSTVTWKKSLDRTVPPGVSTVTVAMKPRHAEPWSIDSPNLYTARVTFESSDGKYSDAASQRFGFRWFDIGEDGGDRRLYLNGKRMVLLGVMSWGFWPVNGVAPTGDFARKDILAAKAMGFNYMNFHRAVGQPGAIDAADELGFFTYEEPGGYSCEGIDDSQTLWRILRREKLIRMVKRDRSHPSLIIYNLQNRTPNQPTDEDRKNMAEAHELDPTRIFTYISGFWEEPPKVSPDKLFYAPMAANGQTTGWYDMHNHTAEPGYADRFYNGPSDYLRYTGIADEVVFWGEDGGVFALPRLQRIHEYNVKNGSSGWLAQRFDAWFESYDSFLDANGFRGAFPDVDAMTTAIGNAAYTYHGRIIENIRAGNLDDAYTINGWAPSCMVNHAGMADLFRNPAGDPAILARYCRPSYIAVKLREKVVSVGGTTKADVFLIDETGFSGYFTLTVQQTGPDGVTATLSTLPVKLKKGEEYGRLLVSDIVVRTGGAHGYYTISATLTGPKDIVKAEGSDDCFAVGLDVEGISRNGAVADTSGAINRFLREQWGFELPRFDPDAPTPAYIVIGRGGIRNAAQAEALMDVVADGATAVVVEGAPAFAEYLASDTMQASDYRGVFPLKKGNFIAGRHPLLDGLPQAKAFGYEYQTFYSGKEVSRTALNLYGARTVIAAVSDNNREVGSALAVIPYGRGMVVLSSLNLLPLLDDESSPSATAKRLFLNYLKYASEHNK